MEESYMSIKNKTVIITGGTRGIGKAIAEAFAKQGANIVISATKQETCDALAKTFAEQYNIKAIGIQTDVSDFDQCNALIDSTKKEFGTIDIIINNAGITRDNLLLRLKSDDWTNVIQTNLNSVFN